MRILMNLIKLTPSTWHVTTLKNGHSPLFFYIPIITPAAVPFGFWPLTCCIY